MSTLASQVSLPAPKTAKSASKVSVIDADANYDFILTSTTTTVPMKHNPMFYMFLSSPCLQSTHVTCFNT